VHLREGRKQLFVVFRCGFEEKDQFSAQTRLKISL